MDFFPSWYILPAAFLLDMAIGDPTWLPHPIRWMGRAMEKFEPVFRKLPMRLSVSGTLFALALIAGTWGVAAALVAVSRALHPALGSVVEILMIYYCISVRCLEKYAMEVYESLANGNLLEAREKVSRIVGRDVEGLDEDGVAQASLESVAENLVDGVISPLFFAAIGGAPFALAYKMVNTLDSMVGYKNDRYGQFGKASARIDDLANFIPARLSVPMISFAAFLLAKSGRTAFKTAIKEGRQHASPNAGYPEAAFAGALSVKLGGAHYYGGRIVPKPNIGIGFGKVKTRHIKKGCDLMILSSVLWIAVMWALALIWNL
jgi:adenosylcobinamide-phosphate synthase